MKKSQIFLIGVAAFFLVSCAKDNLVLTDSVQPVVGKPFKAASANGDVVGKLTVGYQGWFAAPGDGSPINAWMHDNYECWPDCSEYTTTYQTPFSAYPNGQPAKMFSSYDQSTVNKHFEWMQTYGIDCAALQRFANEITPGSSIKSFRDGIANRVKNAAQTYGRKFYIMYDVSGWSDLEALKTDWLNTITSTSSLNLLASSAYAKQNGKPVVSIYGLGYTQHPSTAAQALDLINWFKNQGCYVIGSVPGQWRTGTGDSKAGFIDTYKAFNMISGWAVGRVVDAGYTTWVTGDRDFCAANNMDYQPCVYPGTSFYNTNGASSPKNQFPRNHGDFFWSQLAVIKQAGVTNVYVAMFDEVNEATQIFKTAETASQIPSGRWYLTLDADGVACSSDFYLRLTCDAARMIKGEIPYQATHPTSHTLIANGTYKIINRKSGLALDATGQLTANGTKLQQWSYSGGNNQRWTITNLGNGHYKIIGVQSGRCVDVNGQLSDNGAYIQLWDYAGGDNQQWYISPTSDGYYSIVGVQSGKPMEVTGESTANGALIELWDSNGGTHQQWAIQAP